MKIKYIIISVFVLILLNSCQQPNSFINKPIAVNGVLDLRSWNFPKDGSINLDGEWEFYWEQFLFGSDFDSDNSILNKTYLTVPGVWKGIENNGQKLPGTGYATYRLTILKTHINQSLSLKLPTVGSAYTLYVDGEKVVSVGTTGKEREDSFPKSLPQVIEFDSKDKSIEFVFHVSNFSYSRGGVWSSLQLGSTKEIRMSRAVNFYIDIFLFGSIFIMGIYHLIIFILRRKDKASLAFSLLCFLIAFRQILTGQLFINQLIPSIPWSFVIRFEYLTFYLGIPLYLSFIRYLFPNDVNFLFIRFIRYLSLIFSLFVIFTPVKIFTGSISYFQLLAVLGGIYLVYLHILTIVRKRDHALILLFGFMFLFVMMINDILFSRGLFDSRELFPLGLYVFILIQAFTLASKFMKSFSSVEQLSIDIADAEKKYKSIFENSTDGIYQSSVDGQFLMVNSAFAKIFGYKTPEEILEIKFIQNWYVDINFRKSLIKLLKEEGAIKNVESKVYRKNGDIVYIKENAHVVLDQKGGINYFEGNIVDITEARQIEQLKLEREVAEAANKTKSEFLANMSHEIRTPMNAIIGFTEILMDDEKEKDRKEKLLIIKNAGNSLLKLINSILDFSKIEAGKLDVKEEAFSIISMMDNTRNMFIEAAGGKELELLYDIILPIPEFVCGDEHRLVQVLNNIIGNAVKFTEKGFIKIVCKYEDGNLSISIKDTGIGIAVDKQEAVFQSFSQADMSTEREYGGTGLGLAISRKLVDLLGGDITLESIPGEGSTFIIKIPFKIIEDDLSIIEPNTELKIPINKSSLSESKEIRILLAEDNRINQTLVSVLLNEMSLVCDMVENGKEALERLEVAQYDLLLLDMQMPVMDGLETIKYIRKNKDLKYIYVIALTANAMAGDAEKYINAGCNDYISKPIDRELFKEKIIKILNMVK